MSRKDEIRAKLQAGLHLIPQHMREGVTAHVEKGRQTGGFLTAMLCGDMADAHMRADGTNRAHWDGWQEFLENHLPVAAHGTPERVKAWRSQGGMEGMTDG